MSREVPVRFREGLGVQFPRATRLVILCRTRALAEQASIRMMAATPMHYHLGDDRHSIS